MVRSLPGALSSLLLCLACSHAAAAGFDLSWNDCGSHGASLESFACNTEAGHHDLIVSVVVPNAMPQVVGVEGVLFLSVGQGQVLPDWWRLAPTECRAGQISLVLDVANNPTSCQSIYHPSELFGAVAWDSQYGGDPALARLRFIAATASSNAIAAGTEYTVARIRIANTGTGACGGCNMPACISIESVNVVQPAGVGDQLLLLEESRGHVGWQCPSEWAYPEGRPYCRPGSGCATRTTHPTWGLIKSMYR